MLPIRFSFFGGGGSSKVGNYVEGDKSELNPTLKLQTDKDVYMPGDSVYVTIEICNPLASGNTGSIVPSLLIERLGFEIKGIEKLDIQWFATQKPLAGTKQRRGWYCSVELNVFIVHLAHHLFFFLYFNYIFDEW